MEESSFEQRLYNERREKLKLITELGQQAYPNSYDLRETIPQLRLQYGTSTAEQLEANRVEVSIAGRVMAIRVQGKAGFAVLQQGDAAVELEHPELADKLRIQIYVRKDDVGEQAFALYKLLDLGDHIGVKGWLMRTRTGELTVHVTSLTFLAKAMLALPDKFHGLEDTELRYRQRYLDLFINPEVRDVFVKRAAVLRAIRRFFDSRGYLEVETPMLHTVAGGAAARPFRTKHNALSMDLSLRIAPELFLKRLVVGGLDRVYEINRNFRNEGVSTQHNPEFTMLEFYQAYSNYHDLMGLTEQLIKFVAMEVNGTTKATFNDVEIDLSNWQKLSMREAIIKFWETEIGDPPPIDALRDHETLEYAIQLALSKLGGPAEPFWRAAIDARRKKDEGTVDARRSTLSVTFTGVAGVLRRHGQSYYGKAIAAIFEALAEPHLIQPTIIYDFPLAVSPLSKIKPDEPDWVERFEFYIGGFEVGNAFSELNDPDDQRRRFEAQLLERERGDDEAHAMDEDYVRALGYGLPPTAGEGIGIDRLTMILTGSLSIRDVILFPLMRPQAKTSPEE